MTENHGTMRARPLLRKGLLPLGALLGGSLLGGLGACAEAQAPKDYGDPTLPVATPPVSGIVAYVRTPAGGEAVPSPLATVTIVAKDEEGKGLVVRAGTSETDLREAARTGELDGGAAYTVTVPLLHGRNRVLVHVATEDGARARSFEHVLRYAGAEPGLRVHVLANGTTLPCDASAGVRDGVTAAPAICLRGEVSFAPGSAPAFYLVHARDAAGEDHVAELSADRRFSVPLPLRANERNTVTLTLEGGGSPAPLPIAVTQDGEPPSIVLEKLAAGAAVVADTSSYTLSGRVSDAHGVDDVQLVGAGGATLPVPFPEGRWSATAQLATGENQVTIVARDKAGNEARAPVSIVRERTLELRVPTGNAKATALKLDRFALEGLFTPDDQKGITIVDVPLRPAIVSTLKAIRDPSAYGVDTTKWGDAERNLSRLLNTSPDTADLRGTSVEQLLTVASGVGLPTPRVLADIFRIDVTGNFLDVEVLADVTLELLVGTHPNVARDPSGQPVLRLSLYDVFQDLRPIAARFGPAGGHPGFLDGTTGADVLEPGFAMTIPTRSNLIRYDGLDADRGGRDFVFLRSGGEALSFDFDAKEFTVVGLVDEPKVDLRFRVTEKNGMFRAGTQRNAGADAARPGFFRGSSDVFTASPWLLERLCAESVYRRYVGLHAPSFTSHFAYDAGAIKNAAVLDWDRGWVVTSTAGGIGNPPPPVYAWDLLSEVAQVRLHDGTNGRIPEGQANVAFTLQGLPIGFTADELVQKVKPILRTQEAKLSKLLAGSQGLSPTMVDVFLARAEDGGAPFLFFRAEADSTGPYGYTTPGFFSDAALTQKVSTKGALPGSSDTTHEKVRLESGQRLFFKDDGGKVFGLAVLAVAPESARVHLDAAEATP